MKKYLFVMFILLSFDIYGANFVDTKWSYSIVEEGNRKTVGFMEISEDTIKIDDKSYLYYIEDDFLFINEKGYRFKFDGKFLKLTPAFGEAKYYILLKKI